MVADCIVGYSEVTAARFDATCFETATIGNRVITNDRDCVCREGVPDINLPAARARDNMVSTYPIVCYDDFSSCAIDAAHPVVLDCAVIDGDCRFCRDFSRIMPNAHAWSVCGPEPADQAFGNSTAGGRYHNPDVSEIFRFNRIGSDAGP